MIQNTGPVCLETVTVIKKKKKKRESVREMVTVKRSLNRHGN